MEQSKQKQIEELEKDIAVRMAMAKGFAGSMNNGVEGWLSEYLIEKGWIQIPDAVVLTKEEYEGLKLFVKKYPYAIKETAEKFAENVMHKINDEFMDYRNEEFSELRRIVNTVCKELSGVPTTAELLEKGKEKNKVRLAKKIKVDNEGGLVDCHNCKHQYYCERTYLGGCTDGVEYSEDLGEEDNDGN